MSCWCVGKGEGGEEGRREGGKEGGMVWERGGRRGEMGMMIEELGMVK